MKKNILIIEDETAILYALQANFKISGFDVVALKDLGKVEVFVTEIIKQKPDYIIIGLPLTTTSDFDLLEAFKSNIEIMHVPIIVYTHISEEAEESFISRGVDYYFLKTELNIQEFVEKVKNIIKHKNK